MGPWREILELAVRAPSPHNVQPWRVRILDESRAELWIERARTLPAEDRTGSFILLTMGLFLEAIRIVAGARGLGLTVGLDGEASRFTTLALAGVDAAQLRFAHLELAPLGAGKDTAAAAELAALLARRRTCRTPLLGDPVPAAAVAAIGRVAREHGLAFGHVSDPATIEAVLALNAEAVREDLNAAGYHDELTAWFRVTARAARRSRDGLDARCMNASPVELWMARRAPFALKLPVVGNALLARYRRNLGPVPTLGWLAGPFWDPAAAYRDGAGLLHVWLEITRWRLWILPFGNLVTNRPVAARCEAALGAPDAWLVFKLGFAAPPPESLRRTVDEVLLA